MNIRKTHYETDIFILCLLHKSLHMSFITFINYYKIKLLFMYS